MPKKKVSKKGKKGKKKSCKKSSEVQSVPIEPMAPSYVPPPPKPGEQLVKLLTSHPVDEKEIHGVKVSTRILDNLTPQEIRDLRVVFELFDTNDDGFLGPPEFRRAMKSLGFRMKREEAQQLTTDGSLKGLGMLNFNEFLETVIDKQGDSRDMYDEILKGFTMFDLTTVEPLYNYLIMKQYIDRYRQVATKCSTKVMQKAPSGAFCITSILHLATTGPNDPKKGSITLEDLKKSCEDSNIRFTEQELEEMIEEADINGDGHVDQSEFIRIMLQTNLF